MRSHSGALAGNDVAYDAVLERHGAIRVDTVDQLMNTALLLSQGRAIGAGGVGLVTDSGGLREALIDRATDCKVHLASLSDETRAELTEVLPDVLVPSNPLDAAGQIVDDFDRAFAQGLQILGRAPEVAVLGYEFDGRDDFVYDPKAGGACRVLARNYREALFHLFKLLERQQPGPGRAAGRSAVCR